MDKFDKCPIMGVNGYIEKENTKETNNHRKLKAIFNHFGLENRLDKLTEECIELLMAINRYKEGKYLFKFVIEECGDVKNVIEQLATKYSGIDKVENQKIDRTIERYSIKVDNK